jgi:hypothetical protein
LIESDVATAPARWKKEIMHTSLRIDGANCPTCFNQTLDDLAELDGMHPQPAAWHRDVLERDPHGAGRAGRADDAMPS